MTTLKITAAIAVLMMFSITQGDARGCDGFNRCRCGVTAAHNAGLPLDYNGLNLKMASSYYNFPRTTCHAGAVGIPHAHHVYTVLQCNGDGTALVNDDAGTYTRRVSGNVFVSVTGGAQARAATQTVHYSARSHSKRGYRQQIASYQAPDRFGAGSVH